MEQDLRAFALECSKMATVYLWGGLGEILTEEVIQDRRCKYPKRYDEQYCEHLRQYVGQSVRGFDCSGLIKCFLMGGLFNFVYRRELDFNSDGLLRHSVECGPISTLPEENGICLYLPGHVGIYVGNHQVVEATNNSQFGDGVVMTKLEDRQWTNWFRCFSAESDF